MNSTTRYVIRSQSGFYIFALAPLTNPAWTDRLQKAATYASAAYARRKAAQFHLGDVEIVAVSL